MTAVVDIEAQTAHREDFAAFVLQWPHNVRPAGYYLGTVPPRGDKPPEPADLCPHCCGTGRLA